MAQEGVSLAEPQLAALEKARAGKEAPGEFERDCPGDCGAQAPVSGGTWKGGRRISPQP